MHHFLYFLVCFQGKIELQSNLRAMKEEMAQLAEQLEEEQQAKSDLQKQLTKATNELKAMTSRFENEAQSRIEELESDK